MAEVITKISDTQFRIVKEDNQVYDIAKIKEHIVSLEAQKAKAIQSYDEAIAKFNGLLTKGDSVGVK